MSIILTSMSFFSSSSEVIRGKPGRKEYFCLFSKSGFTDAMKRKAVSDEVKLFKGRELV